MTRTFLSTLTLILLCTTAQAGDGAMKGSLSRGSDGKIMVTPFPKPPLPRQTACEALQSPAHSHIRALVYPLAQEHGVDPRLVMAVVYTESRFNPDAVSPKNAQGLMQILPSTGAELGLKDPFNPAENISAGVRYLRQLMEKYGGDLRLVLSGFNAGMGNVARHGGVPPFVETRDYISTITGLLSCPETLSS